ncbi:MAG: chemotaxis protein CheW [Candidatus Omnitrophota bacterium]
MDEQDKVIIEVSEEEFEAMREVKKTVRVLSFSLGSEHYCIDITDAKEVFRPSAITKVPNAPAFIFGITNIHGEIIPLIDIRYFLGLASKEGLGSTKVIVTDVMASHVGVVVDEVNEAIDIEEDSIQPPLATIKGSLAVFTKGQVQIGNDIIVLLDLKKILNCKEMENLKKGV